MGLELHGPSMLADRPILVIYYNQSNFDSGILCQDFIPAFSDKPRMTPVSLVKATESYDVCRLGHQLGSIFTGTDRTGLITATANLPNAPKQLITASDQTSGRA